MLKIYCEKYDFSALAAAFDGEYFADCDLSLEIEIVGGDEIRQLNARTRGVDAVTDVLSYPALDGIKGKEIRYADFPYDADGEGGIFAGSIAICEERAREQAKEYGHSFEREMNYLAAHGVCHILGYDHMNDDEKAEMREKEESVLGKINLKRDIQ